MLDSEGGGGIHQTSPPPSSEHSQSSQHRPPIPAQPSPPKCVSSGSYGSVGFRRPPMPQQPPPQLQGHTPHVQLSPRVPLQPNHFMPLKSQPSFPHHTEPPSGNGAPVRATPGRVARPGRVCVGQKAGSRLIGIDSKMAARLRECIFGSEWMNTQWNKASLTHFHTHTHTHTHTEHVHRHTQTCVSLKRSLEFVLSSAGLVRSAI